MTIPKETARFDELYRTLSGCVTKLDQLPPEAIDDAIKLAEEGQAAYLAAKARLDAATQRINEMFPSQQG